MSQPSIVDRFRAWRQARTAQTYLEQGACRKAASLYQRVLDQLPGDAGAWLWRGVALAECGQHSQARRHVEQGLSLWPAASVGRLLQARVLYDAGELEPARLKLLDYLEGEENQQARGLLALCSLRFGHGEPARHILTDRFPHAPWLLARLLVVIEEQAGDPGAQPPGAVPLPSLAVDGPPPGWLARRRAKRHRRRGLLCLRAEKWEEALAALGRAYPGLPGDPMVGYGLGTCLYAERHYDPARRRLLEVAERLEEPFSSDAQATLGKISLELHDLPDALIRLRRSIGAGAQSPENFYALGLVFLQRGRRDLARKAFQRCATVEFVRQRLQQANKEI